MTSPANQQLANTLIEEATKKGVMIATAESCTGGMIAASLTDIAGSSAVVDRGFVTYSNEAKADMLGVPLEHAQTAPGAVSALVAEEMVQGALARSNASLAVAVTGIAGPGGGSTEKPVGLVYIAVGHDDHPPQIRECRFTTSHGATTREAIRNITVTTALEMLIEAIKTD